MMAASPPARDMAYLDGAVDVAAGEGGANDCLTGGPFCNLLFIFFFSGGAVGGGDDANGETIEGFC
jgi:hypothetical protein